MFYFWEKFWFENKTDLQIGYFRISFLFITFIFYLLKLFDLDFLYSSKSVVLPYNLDTLISPLHRLPLFVFPESEFGIQLLFGVLFLGLIVGLLGVLPRIGFIPLLIIHLLLVHRNPTVIYGADTLISLGLFGLCMMGCGAPLLFGKKETSYFLKDFKECLSSVGLRLIQIQISIIYCFTALEKVRGDSWWNGSALWNVFSNTQLMTIDLSFFGSMPTLIVLMTWFIIFFELFFAIAVWTEAKNFFLAIGVVFHITIGLLMGLWFFSFLILSFYLLFLTNPNNELDNYGLN